MKRLLFVLLFAVISLFVLVPMSVVTHGSRDSKQMDVDARADKRHALSHGGSPPAGYFVIGYGPVIGPKQ